MNLGGEADHYGEEEVDEEAAEYLYRRDDKSGSSGFDWDAVLATTPIKGGGKGGRAARGGKGGGDGGGGARGKKRRGGKKSNKPKVDPLVEIRKKEMNELLAAYPSLQGTCAFLLLLALIFYS